MGILTNPKYPETEVLATQIAETLHKQGIEVARETSDQVEGRVTLPTDLDILVTLGGDGTMLRAAHLVAAQGTPILGIHMGNLGFLAEVRRDEWKQSLESVLAGQYWLEQRSMLCCKLEHEGTTSGPWEALNDVVVGRYGVSHIVELATYVDGGYFTTYVCDGLIIATATGSTAYALSAGGPVLPPELRNMLMVPICPHLSLDRTIVLDEGAGVVVRVLSTVRGVLAVDGTAVAELQADDKVILCISPYTTLFVRLYDRRRVYETLMERLQRRKVSKPDE